MYADNFYTAAEVEMPFAEYAAFYNGMHADDSVLIPADQVAVIAVYQD